MLLAMLVGNNESATTKNAGESPDGAHPGLYSKPLDAAIGRVPEPYRPGGRHGQRIC